jgi:hypothetical protein
MATNEPAKDEETAQRPQLGRIVVAGEGDDDDDRGKHDERPGEAAVEAAGL